MLRFITLALAFSFLSADASDRPNVLLIVADDLGYHDVGFQGSKEIPTPHLDRLAASGVRCTNGYVSHPFCSPTRAGIMTGRYQHRFGHENNPVWLPEDTKQGLPLAEITLPQLMQKLEKHGCDKSVVGVVIPSGYSFNLDGTCIYLTLAALFVAQATNTHLTLWQQLGLLAVLLLTSKGAAGVTGAGFITLVATLSTIDTGIPVAGLAMLIGIDRFMSEARALTNLVGNTVATLVVAKWENGFDAEKGRMLLRASQ